MSIKATNWVWSLDGDVPCPIPNATIKLVLLKHADHAHDDGTHTWQSVESVAKYALCSVRTAQRANGWLIENGYMREGDQSVIPDHYDPRRRPVAYELAMSEATRQEWEALNAAGGNALRASAQAAGAKGAAAKAQVRTGDNLTPQDSVSNGPDLTGDNLTPQDSGFRGDTGDALGVTNEPFRGDTGVTQTTHSTIQGNHPSSSSQAADASSDPEKDQDSSDDDLDREDITRICEHLRNRIIEQDYKPVPSITKEWRRTARLMLDRDGRTERQVHNMIEWATNDDFWRPNIRSMRKLREKYDQMKERAAQETLARGTRRGYDDVATWGKAEDEQPTETLTDAEAAAIFGAGRQDKRPAANG